MSIGAFARNVICALLYVAVYARSYMLFLHGEFGYMGYDLFSRDAVFLALAIVIAVLPVLAYRGYRAVSSVIAVFVYLILYVPIILTFAFGYDAPAGVLISIELTFMGGMIMLFLADLVTIEFPLRLGLGVDLMPLVLVGSVAAVAYMAVLYRGSMSFAGFGEELYDQRFANEALGAGLIARYVSSWLSTVLVPLCLAYGLTTRRQRYVIVGSVACLILYMGAANKISILLPFVYVALFLLFKGRLRSAFPLIALALSAAMGALTFTALVPGSIAFIVSAILISRSIGNGGLLAMKYLEFFSFHPHTAYSHVNGINWFTKPYPYGDLIVGQVVGQHYWSTLTNANASFWATDGIAAIGLPGVIVASLLCVGLLVVMNSATHSYDQLFVVLSFLPFIITLLNQSLFSSVWSGGAFFLILFFLFGRPVVLPRRRVPSGTLVGVASR